MDEKNPAWKQLKQPYSWILDAAVFLALTAIVLYTISKHEPWADEADTWLEVRDIPFLRLLFSELRYDGHMPLWHSLVWVPMHLFHMSYANFVFIGGVCAIAGLAVLIFLAPFPRILRYLIAASFYFIYQYAVIARPYVLMPLLGFLAAHFYRQGLSRIIGFSVCVALLVLDSSYAAVIGMGFAAFYGIQLALRWKEIALADRKRIFAGIAIIVASFLFVVVLLFPKSDSSLVAEASHLSFSLHLFLVGEGLAGAFAETLFLAPALLLILSAIWAYQRRSLLLLIFAVGGTAAEYGFLRGFGHHQGLISIAFVVFLWAAWPSARQFQALSRNSRLLHQALLAAVLLTFAWQCAWSYNAIRGDWAGPYTGALDAAQFLKSVHADTLGCTGYMYWAVGVQPYFDRNIFLNYGGPHSPASYHFSFDFDRRATHITDWQAQNGPPFLLVSLEQSPQQAMPTVQLLRSLNYILIHSSDGTRFFKGSSGVHSLYLIFERTDFAWSQQASSASGKPKSD
jgi:hypothetical protein